MINTIQTSQGNSASQGNLTQKSYHHQPNGALLITFFVFFIFAILFYFIHEFLLYQETKGKMNTLTESIQTENKKSFFSKIFNSNATIKKITNMFHVSSQLHFLFKIIAFLSFASLLISISCLFAYLKDLEENNINMTQTFNNNSAATNANLVFLFNTIKNSIESIQNGYNQKEKTILEEMKLDWDKESKKREENFKFLQNEISFYELAMSLSNDIVLLKYTTQTDIGLNISNILVFFQSIFIDKDKGRIFTKDLRNKIIDITNNDIISKDLKTINCNQAILNPSIIISYEKLDINSYNDFYIITTKENKKFLFVKFLKEKFLILSLDTKNLMFTTDQKDIQIETLNNEFSMKKTKSQDLNLIKLLTLGQ